MNELDFQSQASYGHDPYTYKKSTSHVDWFKIEWKQTDGRTDGRTQPIALPSRLMRSVSIASPCWRKKEDDDRQHQRHSVDKVRRCAVNATKREHTAAWIEFSRQHARHHWWVLNVRPTCCVNLHMLWERPSRDVGWYRVRGTAMTTTRLSPKLHLWSPVRRRYQSALIASICIRNKVHCHINLSLCLPITSNRIVATITSLPCRRRTARRSASQPPNVL